MLTSKRKVWPGMRGQGHQGEIMQLHATRHFLLNWSHDIMKEISLQEVTQLCKTCLWVSLCVCALLYACMKDTEGCVIPTKLDAVCILLNVQ